MKRKHTVGYFSSYDRGLEYLLAMWPKVKEHVPDAELHIYYGWNQFDHAHKTNPANMKWKWQMIRKMHEVGAIDHGRVSHKELARAMQQTKVWAYPTEFTEIHCITALKAQEAGCIPVTSLCYALEETVADQSFSVPCTDIGSNDAKQAEFIAMIVKALNTDRYKPKQIKQPYWSDVAKVWSKALA